MTDPMEEISVDRDMAPEVAALEEELGRDAPWEPEEWVHRQWRRLRPTHQRNRQRSSRSCSRIAR